MTIGKDGAIYFAVGGRGGQSELYVLRTPELNQLIL